MHVHGPSFRVVGRHSGMHGASAVSAGYVDEGCKDTVLVMPGEVVRIRLTFAHYRGLYLYHCHNLEHEDMGMMRNYFIA
jgi:blue copper oxidase